MGKKKTHKKTAKASAAGKASGSPPAGEWDITEWTHDQLGNFVKLTINGGGHVEIFDKKKRIMIRAYM
jgi:hypothetical protein